MTLILCIPCKQGRVIVADAQNSHLEGALINPERIDKTLLLESIGCAIASSGDTGFYKDLYCQIEDDSNITQANIVQKIKDRVRSALRDKDAINAGFDSQNFSAFVVLKDGISIKTKKIIGFEESDEGDENYLSFIGLREIHRHVLGLKFDLNNFEKEDAIKFGFALIEYVSVMPIGSTVGNPKVLGGKTIFVPKGEGSIEKKDYSSADCNKFDMLFKVISDLYGKGAII